MCEVDGFEAVLILGLLLWDLGIVVSRGLRKELKEEFLFFSTFMIQPCDRGAGWELELVGLLSALGHFSSQHISWHVFCSCHLSIVEGCVSRALKLLKNIILSASETCQFGLKVHCSPPLELQARLVVPLPLFVSLLQTPFPSLRLWPRSSTALRSWCLWWPAVRSAPQALYGTLIWI